MAGILKKKKTKKGEKVILNFSILCQIPVEDKVFEVEEFVDFLKSNIKVNGKKGQLGTAVTVSGNDGAINVTAEAPFSKRYLKYLSKKYLRRIQVRDFLHVIAVNGNRAAYELRYFKIPGDDE